MSPAAPTQMFRCPACRYEWPVDGRYDVEGRFEPFDADLIADCSECAGPVEPVDRDLVVAA